MPAQQSLGTDEEADPARAGQASAETCERQTISRPPTWPLDLALEDAQLVPEDQELEPEAGVRASVIDEGIEEQTEDGIEKSEKHDRASCQVVDPLVAQGPPVPRPEFLDRTASCGLGCPRLQRPAATGRRWDSFLPTRIRGASLRTTGRQ